MMKNYDVVGHDEPVYERRPTRRGGREFNGFYEADFDADEIFRNFFFGGMHPAATTQFQGFSFGPRMGARTEPIYSFSRIYPYEHWFTTQKGVEFYVSSGKFELEYPPNSPERMAIEQRVEKDYYSALVQNCRLELQRLQWGWIRETLNCDALKKFEMVA
ncbi:unnamed protein product [Ilex paraguariensis]|uniref:DUF1977 domain-containing protein n=1 Tax=Ilex paraguariensis TaxID=185542 RepID=A0ABC8RR25_9AQUA